MAYKYCKFCHGRGCLACEGERKRDMERQIEPAFVAKTPEDLELLKEAVGREALEKAYAGPNLEHEIQFNLAVAAIEQQLRKD